LLTFITVSRGVETRGYRGEGVRGG
jgi:hypothetical protein